MKKLFLLAAVSVLSLGAGQAMAETATQTGQAKATIVNDVQISAVDSKPLDFGTIVSTNSENKVTVKALDGTRSASVDGSLSSVRNSTAGEFTINGSPNVTVTLNAIAPISLSGPGAAMSVTNLSYNKDTVTLDEKGEGDFQVGGVLTVNAAQEAGEYTGEYTVTASY